MDTDEQHCGSLLVDSGVCKLQGTKDCISTSKLRCVRGLTADDDTGKCIDPEAKKGVLKEGDRCDPDSDSAEETCSPNQDLHCHPHYRVCVKAGKAGDSCVTDRGYCEANTECNFGVCTPYGTVPDFSRVVSDELCKSAYEKDNVCIPTYAQKPYSSKCFSNGDCQEGVCDEKNGVCIEPYQKAYIDYVRCKGDRCRGDEKAKDCETSTSLCASSFARLTCAEMCVRRADARELNVKAGDTRVAIPYQVNCADFTIKKLPDNSCTLKTTDIIQNCDKYFSSRMFIQSPATTVTSTVVVLVVVAITTVLAIL